jgi:hypothetical protein
MSESSGNFDADSIEPGSKELVKTEEPDSNATIQSQEKAETDTQVQSKKPGNPHLGLLT